MKPHRPSGLNTQNHGHSMSTRKFSIITPSLNRARFLEAALQSVVAQNYCNYEHIIIDGGSTDETEQIVRKFPGINFVSGPDQGMYDALNKGLEIATGEIIGFLNTDDLYAERIFPVIAPKFEDTDVMAVAGRAIVFSELIDGNTAISDKYSPDDRSLLECSTIGSNYFNAWFFRRSVFVQIGNFNADYKIVGDRDFMLRFALNNLRYEVINDLVYQYREHEDSLTFDKDDQKREWSANEHLVMTSIYLTKQNLSETARKLLAQLRTIETVDMAARSMWLWNYKKFIRYSREGFKYNFAWVFSFLQYIIKRGVPMVLAKLSIRK